jgi:hypothetical protein
MPQRDLSSGGRSRKQSGRVCRAFVNASHVVAIPYLPMACDYSCVGRALVVRWS